MTLEQMHAYHKENPQIFTKFVEFTLQAIQSGRSHFGAGMIAERIRWYTNIEARGEFKFSNDMRAYYVRMFENNYPQYAGFFRKKASVADGVSRFGSMHV